MSEAPIKLHDAYLGLGAWLGAIVERLRRGDPAIPGDGTAEADDADAASFGAVSYFAVKEWRLGPVECSQSLDRLLDEINALAKDKAGETELWNALFGHLPTPINPKLALDLIDRGIGHIFLGHSWQEEDVWWRLVDLVPEAVENLAISRYSNAHDDWSRVEEVLYQFDWQSLLTTLSQNKPSSVEKARLLAARIFAHPDAESIIMTRRVRHEMFNAAWDELTGEQT